MEEIDEETVPPVRKEDDDFQPYVPKKEGEEGLLTKPGLKKKLLKLGQGWDWETPDIGDEITVNYTATVLDGAQFVSDKDKGEPLIFRIGHESWDMESEEKIEYALKRKGEGNAYFKVGKYQRASIRYNMAAKYVEFNSTFSEDQKKHGEFIKISCYLNNAACKLKLKEFREAANLCSKVLKLESHNLKALFRRAQAYVETADLDLAELDLKKAQEIDPDSREVQAELARLKKLQSYYDKKESKLYANMIDKLKLSDSSSCQKLAKHQLFSYGK